MRRTAAGALIMTILAFLVSLPLLHLHPAVEHAGFLSPLHRHSAVIHSHLPDEEDFHSQRTDHAGCTVTDGDDALESKPLDVAAISAPAQPTASEFPAVVELAVMPAPDRVIGFAPQPKAEAQPPPGFRIAPALRGPPSLI